jgi:hypothetical protein
MLQPTFLAGFTGHRSGFDEEMNRAALREALQNLANRAGAIAARLDLYASVAEGSDVLCVETARELAIPVHVILPLPEEEFARDFSSPAAWERSRVQIDRIKGNPSRDSIRVVDGNAARPDCYFNQGITMLSAIDVLVALWDGAPSRSPGGTAEMIAQARRMGLPVVVIDSTSGKVHADQAIEACFAPDATIAELSQIAASAGIPKEGTAGNPEVLQDSLDAIATEEASRFRPSLARTVVCHGIAALLGAVVAFDGHAASRPAWKWPLALLQFILVSAALWMSYRLRRKHTQQRWIRCRFACELVRSIRASVPLLDPLHLEIAVHRPEWRRFALSASLLVLEHRPRLDSIQLRDEYLVTRLSESHPDGQIRHYRKMSPSATRRWRIAGKVSIWAASLSPVFVFLSFLNKLNKYRPVDSAWNLEQRPSTWILVVFLPIALPLVAGAANSLRHSLDAGRRNERYPQMVARLLAIRTSLEGLTTEYTIRAAVAQSEEALMDELIEWQFAMRNSAR